MARLSFKLICQIYLLLVLVVATILAPFPYSPLSLAMLLVVLFSLFRPSYLKLNLVIMVAIIFILPLSLEPLLSYVTLLPLILGQVVVTSAVLPVIYLVDCNLRQNAANNITNAEFRGRRMAIIPRTLFISTLTVLFLSLILNNPVLLFTGIAFLLYLIAILVRVLLALSGLPIDISSVRKRIVAGTTDTISLYLASKVSIRLYSLFSPVDSWAKIMPQRLVLNGPEIELKLTITPPLAGPSYLQLCLSVIDPWGFVQVNQRIKPVELHVIPRARYAEWLAMKYLEQTGPGIAVAAALTPRINRLPKRGVEYFDSRNYQPGDSLASIDWKHTLKLSQLVIKEYIEAGDQVAIIAANLSVADAEEADRLAFNLITLGLTLAQRAVPTALAAYNHQKIVLVTTVLDPREALKDALSLVKDITVVEFAHQFLQPADIGQLRRNVTLLRQATSEPAQRLLGMLNLELQAREKAAESHPATRALSLVTEHAPLGAKIMPVSQLNHDVEALMITLERLARRGFTTIPVEALK